MNTAKMLHGTQLSFIQLGGGITVAVQLERKKYHTLVWDNKPTVSEWSSIIVWTTTQVHS